MTPDQMRVKCPSGHWVTVRTILATDLRTRLIAPGQRCRQCGKEIKA